MSENDSNSSDGDGEPEAILGSEIIKRGEEEQPDSIYHG